jgi:hypothetical protein
MVPSVTDGQIKNRANGQAVADAPCRARYDAAKHRELTRIA